MDCEAIPTNRYGSPQSVLHNEALADEVALHLQSLGKYIHAQDIVDYMDRSNVQKRYALKKGINVRTAVQWLHRTVVVWSA